MKKRFLKNIFMRFITWVLLIQVINISIDPIDPVSNKLHRFATQEDLSIYEFASEQCKGEEVPEHDEDDESGRVKVMDFYFADSSVKNNARYQYLQVLIFATETNFSTVVLDHTSPPPKVA